jgi:transcriptional regulator with XRE-family HTH domain
MNSHPRRAVLAEGDEKKLQDLSRARLEKLLAVLEEQGISQREVAKRLTVPASYLSDVKNGRRPVTELLAGRFHKEYGVEPHWLLGSAGSMDVPPLAVAPANGDSRRAWLPVFVKPISGDPTQNADWDGSCVELAGVAAVRVLFADRPYVLRLGVDDRAGRLRRGDLVLISQAVEDAAQIQVLKTSGKSGKMFLARRDAEGGWQRLSHIDDQIVGEPLVVGHCLGVVWSKL